MQDRPSAGELLYAVESFLDDLVHGLEGSRSFHARVAANAVRIVRREIENEDAAIAAEWSGLDAILGSEARPDTLSDAKSRLRERNEALCERIRLGQADDDAVFEHVRSAVHAKLRVSDPALLERSGHAFEG